MRFAETSAVGESAYRRIRTDIVFGKLAPRQKLKLDGLRDRYGASISTLREILSRLSSEGLVSAEGQRGFEVAPISRKDLEEVAAMRNLLEGHAIEHSFRRGDMEWEARVVGAHHKLSSLDERVINGDRGETQTWKRYDWEFHEALISACDSAVLLRAHAEIYDKYLRYQMIGLIFRREAVAEHRSLLDCALRRDWRTAQAVLTEHVNGCVQYAVEIDVFGWA